MTSSNPSSGNQDTVAEAVDEAYCSACNSSYPAETVVCPKDGSRLVRLAAEKDELIGKVLDGRYEIRSPLGKGGMGTVYRGWQLSVDREVAIKVIHPKLSSDRSIVKRFLRESRLASRLSQPNIVNMYDFGQSEQALYIVMELLRGHTLASELSGRRRIAIKRVAVIGMQLCDALEAAHAQGIVHRDLKPGNIVILDDPPGRDLIKVLDFGLAKSLVNEVSGSAVTNTSAILGTPLYMAPEQIEGKPSDQRADLYSLGCILYEMVSGRPPFVDNVVSAVLARHIGDEPAPLPASVPQRLRDLIDRLLAKRPEDRVQTAAEARLSLELVRESSGARPESTSPDLGTSMDTVPDVHSALAETDMALVTPISNPRLISAALEASATSPTVTPTPASGRRYAVVAFFALIPIAGLAFVMFMKTNTSPDRAGSPSKGDTRAADPAFMQANPVGAAPDAGVAGVDAAPELIAPVEPPPRPQVGEPKPPKKTTRPPKRAASKTTNHSDAKQPAPEPNVAVPPPTPTPPKGEIDIEFYRDKKK